MSISLDDALPEKRAARRAFDRAREFETACFIHDEARTRLLERLDFLKLDPRVVVDLGCATGRGAAALATRYPTARALAVDSSLGMLTAAARCAGRFDILAGDAEALPLRSNTVDLLLANLVLPWCRPERVLGEAARVLTAGGIVLFATLGPDSLKEVRSAFAAVDDRIHVHAAFDLHDLGDLAMAAGLAEPVLDVDRLEVTYPDLVTLVRDLRAAGAMNVAGGRRRTLTAPVRWRAFEAMLSPARARLAVTVELILGQAWGRGPRPPRGEVRVPIEQLRRPSEST